ncbi:MAG: hypothetical protein HY863_19680 [Chloroflexi bacterium]|nr:hypothetical protein [Chloroflexota bacterium]
MPIKSVSIAERLNIADLAISNSRADAEIQSLVAAYGYSPAKLTEGHALYTTALAAVTAQKFAAGEQRQTTRELTDAGKSARDAYQSLAKVARAIFKNDKARLTALGLSSAAPRSTAEFLAAAASLFDNAAQAPALEAYGYDPERLESERAKITAFNQANQRQEAAKGAAQQASREQLAAMASLDAWRAQYIKIARVALRGKKQLLEKLGVPARTSARRTTPPTPATA